MKIVCTISNSIILYIIHMSISWGLKSEKVQFMGSRSLLQWLKSTFFASFLMEEWPRMGLAEQRKNSKPINFSLWGNLATATHTHAFILIFPFLAPLWDFMSSMRVFVFTYTKKKKGNCIVHGTIEKTKGWA